jgi:hypothetical protein
MPREWRVVVRVNGEDHEVTMRDESAASAFTAGITALLKGTAEHEGAWCYAT